MSFAANWVDERNFTENKTKATIECRPMWSAIDGNNNSYSQNFNDASRYVEFGSSRSKYEQLYLNFFFYDHFDGLCTKDSFFLRIRKHFASTVEQSKFLKWICITTQWSIEIHFFFSGFTNNRFCDRISAPKSIIYWFVRKKKLLFCCCCCWAILEMYFAAHYFVGNWFHFDDAHADSCRKKCQFDDYSSRNNWMKFISRWAKQLINMINNTFDGALLQSHDSGIGLMAILKKTLLLWKIANFPIFPSFKIANFLVGGESLRAPRIFSWSHDRDGIKQPHTHDPFHVAAFGESIPFG